MISAHADVCIIIHPQSFLWRSFGPLWMPFGHPQDILWKSSGHPLEKSAQHHLRSLDTLWTSSRHLPDFFWTPLDNHLTFSGHLYLLAVLVSTSSRCHLPDVLCIFFCRKRFADVVVFPQSQFYCVNVPGFLVSSICTTAP